VLCLHPLGQPLTPNPCKLKAKSIFFEKQSPFRIQREAAIKLPCALWTDNPPISPTMGQILRPPTDISKTHGETGSNAVCGAVSAKIELTLPGWRVVSEYECYVKHSKNKICRNVARASAPFR
jgi:hypothetical protein